MPRFVPVVWGEMVSEVGCFNQQHRVHSGKGPGSAAQRPRRTGEESCRIAAKCTGPGLKHREIPRVSVSSAH